MDESNPYRSPKRDATTRDAGTAISQRLRAYASDAQASLAAAVVMIVLDVILGGSFLFSYLACPIWFLVSVVKNVIQRPAWEVALFRIAVPALTLGVVLTNYFVQRKIAHVHADRIINACEEFHVAYGKYPHTLDELVPRYLGSIPRAKYCLCWGEFVYLSYEDKYHLLLWCDIPPFDRVTYNLEDRRWGYLD
jgi:hypothetical protein